MLFFKQRRDIQAFECFVGDGKDGGVELFCRQLIGDLYVVRAPYGVWVGPRVVDCNLEIVFLESSTDVDNLGVTYVGTIFLEGEAENEDVGVKYLQAFFQHELHGLTGYVLAHTVVHASAGEDDLGVVAVPLGALG